MQTKVVETRDGYVFEGDQPDPFMAAHLITLFQYDKALVSKRMEMICSEGHGSIHEQAEHSVACDRACKEAAQWRVNGDPRIRTSREVR